MASSNCFKHMLVMWCVICPLLSCLISNFDVDCLSLHACGILLPAHHRLGHANFQINHQSSSYTNGKYCSRRVIYYSNHTACFQILLLSGDIQVNPGPHSPNSDSRSRETTDVRVAHGSQGVHGVLLNARSVTNKLLDIQTYVYTRNFQIVGISETWLALHIPSASILNEFIIFRNDRNTNGGGVLLALSPLLDPIELTSHHSFPNTSSQSVWASINIANKRWLCGVFYRPKPTDMEVLDYLEQSASRSRFIHCKVIFSFYRT